jgi:hypothetical protein
MVWREASRRLSPRRVASPCMRVDCALRSGADWSSRSRRAVQSAARRDESCVVMCSCRLMREASGLGRHCGGVEEPSAGIPNRCSSHLEVRGRVASRRGRDL